MRTVYTFLLIFVILIGVTGCQQDKPQNSAASKLLAGERPEILGGVVNLADTPLPAEEAAGLTYLEYCPQPSQFHFMLLPRAAENTLTIYRLALENITLVREQTPVLRAPLSGSTAFIFCGSLPEGLPHMSVCLQSGTREACWQPRYNGEAEHLLLDEGFMEIPLRSWEKHMSAK